MPEKLYDILFAVANFLRFLERYGISNELTEIAVILKSHNIESVGDLEELLHNKGDSK